MSQDEEYAFTCLVALHRLVTCQAPCLNGRELGILEALFDISRTPDKNVSHESSIVRLTLRLGSLQVRTGAECVAMSVVSATEPLYAASCLRVCMEGMQDPTSTQGISRNLDEAYSWTFAMGLKALGTLFSLLPTEVLEEEVVRSRELIKKVSGIESETTLFLRN